MVHYEGGDPAGKALVVGVLLRVGDGGGGADVEASTLAGLPSDSYGALLAPGVARNSGFFAFEVGDH